MKFSCQVKINKPIDQVITYFKDPQYLKEYQEGFIKKELISGEEGSVGAISKMYYKQGKGQMVITEEIMIDNLPDEFLGSYHHKHMDNTMRCKFSKVDTNSTLYISEIEYTAFRGFMPKMLARLFPGMFKKQVQKWLDNFKGFVEEQ